MLDTLGASRSPATCPSLAPKAGSRPHPRTPAAFRRPRSRTVFIGAAGLLVVAGALAGGEQTLPTVEVTGRAADLVGVANAASVGTVTKKQLEARTVYRVGELLEATPGLIVSQHSGEGKANQFYLRGFNLDHGTDLRTTVDGMLVNQRSHSHGQGWTDLNFVIPELVTRLEYKKGPYDAREGDFSSAGAVSLQYAEALPRGIASVGLGQNGYRRTLLANAGGAGSGTLLYALEFMHNDGPFVSPDDFGKFNGVLRYSQGDLANGFNVTLMAYKSRWNSTDQIPRRAVEAGLDRFDTIDRTDGGRAQRYSLSTDWRRIDAASATRVRASLVASELELYSNFTYFLNDPVNGDQFAQPDRRTTSAVQASHTWAVPGSRESEFTVGVQLQNDNVFNALQNTRARQVLSTVRADHIVESSAGVYLENATRWTERVRTVAGLRADHYRFKVNGDLPANAGNAADTIVNPKLGIVFGPWARTEYYINAGGGFHSNDARGTTLTVDPATGAPADKVSPLVRSRGYEVGVRTSIVPGLQSSLSVYRLGFDSELLFVGDAGTTEAGRPSQRTGIEFANYYKPNDWLTIDGDIAFARARFRDADPAGQRIPGAVEGVASLAVAVDNLGPWFGAVQWRYFGPRPLIEDDSVRSRRTALLNGRLGYRFSRDLKVELEGYNLANRKVSSIDYYYTSRLPGEPAAGFDDIHFHPVESRSFRVTMTLNF